MERLELAVGYAHETGIKNADTYEGSLLVPTLKQHTTPQQITQRNNEIISKKINLFKGLKKGTVVLAIPKNTKTNQKYDCTNCGYVGEMNSVSITGYEYFTRRNGEGKEVKDSRFYTTPPILDLCPECGTSYREKDIAKLI